ncbi:hypothetical protein E1287_14265 [Actinomadura sp. KC06]|uniref:hypothetical protein n=1 Tax=Actinomadura sp. KC06 TaxID=2530369 RepID=UPI001045AB46|nr:hypothetical protein [Actinomadura sp. KC06]TDD35268.1 hypothetical protein E1287_14265 [Actinomadura sp. KC06]
MVMASPMAWSSATLGRERRASLTGLCRDVNPIMSPISCHAPGNDGKPHGIGGEPNSGGHVYRGRPFQYNPGKYH